MSRAAGPVSRQAHSVSMDSRVKPAKTVFGMWAFFSSTLAGRDPAIHSPGPRRDATARRTKKEREPKLPLGT